MALPEVKPFTRKYAWAYMADVSTASSAFTVAPCRGRLTKVWTVLGAAITGANAAVTVEINGTAVTGIGITVTQSGSAAGDVDEDVPTTLSTAYVNEGDTIEFVSDGASSTTAPLMCCAEIEMD